MVHVEGKNIWNQANGLELLLFKKRKRSFIGISGSRKKNIHANILFHKNFFRFLKCFSGSYHVMSQNPKLHFWSLQCFFTMRGMF